MMTGDNPRGSSGGYPMQHARRKLHRARRHNDWLVWLLHPYRDPINRPGYRVPARIVPAITIVMTLTTLCTVLTALGFIIRGGFDTGRLVYVGTMLILGVLCCVAAWYQGHRQGSLSWPEHRRG